jgi:hypothetical protein
MDMVEHERWWRERGGRELCELLFYEWDPIGLSRLADQELDEYEHYAGQLARRLRAGAGEDELGAVLEGFRTEMGLEPAAESSLEIARRIRDWYARSKEEWAAAARVSSP